MKRDAIGAGLIVALISLGAGLVAWHAAAWVSGALGGIRLQATT